MKKMVIFSSIVEKKGVIYQLVVWGQEKIWVPRKTSLFHVRDRCVMPLWSYPKVWVRSIEED